MIASISEELIVKDKTQDNIHESHSSRFISIMTITFIEKTKITIHKFIKKYTTHDKENQLYTDMLRSITTQGAGVTNFTSKPYFFMAQNGTMKLKEGEETREKGINVYIGCSSCYRYRPKTKNASWSRQPYSSYSLNKTENLQSLG